MFFTTLSEKYYLVLFCCYDDIHIFGGEILACKSSCFHIDFLVQWVTVVAHETGLGGAVWPAVELQDSGLHTICIFSPLPVSLSNESATKTLEFPLIVWLQEHRMSKLSIHVMQVS